jgi:CubicO group peptidase (beta-lactamase class C family)
MASALLCSVAGALAILSGCTPPRPHATAASPAPQTLAPESLAEARAFVDSLRAARSLPGMAVTVTRAGRIVMSEGFGLANRERGLAATPNTKFRVGSVSKLFTAVALMRLVEEGVVALGAPLRLYIDPYPPHWPDMTLRQLAGHVAGIRHYRGAEFFSRTEYASLRDANAVFTGDSLLFAPGARYSYSSYGYNLLGAALESAVNEPFPTLAARLVFAPLGMTATVPDSVNKPIAGRAALYNSGRDSIAATPSDNLSSRWPSGGYLSSTSDLARFGGAMLDHGILRRESLEIMFTAQRLANGDSIPVGIGWRIGADSAGRPIVHHGGSSNGGSAFLLVYPRERVVVAMAANSFSSWGEREARRLAEFFLP